MSEKKLARHVTVAGTTYGPGDDVPADVIKQITNPKAWLPADETDDEEDDEDSGRDAGTTSGRKLAGSVTVGGRSWGPKDHIPDDVAKTITNPKAWEGGKLPTFAKSAETPATEPVGSAPATKKAAPAAGDKRS